MITNIMLGLEARRDALLERFENEDGVTAIEYGLIAALIAVVIIAALTLVGTELSNIFNFIGGELQNAGS